ncbi:MAG: FecR domain-containing protein [Bacteroidota bacterium]
MSIDRFKYLFHQFVNKTATAEESTEFLAMMKGNDYNKAAQVLLDEFWNESISSRVMSEDKAERIFNQIMLSSQQSERKRILPNRSWFTAAALVLLVGASIFFYKKSPTSEKIIAVVNQPAKQDKPNRRFINLPDGSYVILNENSSIELSNFGSKGNREVILHGEAYFDVVHDSSRPFIVTTGKIRTTVLGTAFNINSNTKERIVVVTVTRGKVQVGDKTRAFSIIDPDEQVVFNSDLDNHVKKLVKAEEFVEWTNEDIYFDDVNIKDVAGQLQKRFNISIVFTNELIKNCRFSATFLKTQTLEQILKVIGEFNNIKYQFKDKNTVLLEGPGCN